MSSFLNCESCNWNKKTIVKFTNEIVDWKIETWNFEFDKNKYWTEMKFFTNDCWYVEICELNLKMFWKKIDFKTNKIDSVKTAELKFTNEKNEFITESTIIDFFRNAFFFAILIHNFFNFLHVSKNQTMKFIQNKSILFFLKIWRIEIDLSYVFWTRRTFQSKTVIQFFYQFFLFFFWIFSQHQLMKVSKRIQKQKLLFHNEFVY